jgi:signal transduction histidine kinase
MIEPKDHPKERERLKELKSYSILDTLLENEYDNLTTIAAEICGTPISLISLIDNKRQWFKSHHGLAASETPKQFAFCAHAINDDCKVFIVQDARLDVRFHDNPLVTGDPNVIFYAGIPLISDDDLPLGTLCVIDHTPRLLSQSQIHSLTALADQVMSLLKLRRNKKQLREAYIKLEEKNQELERFAFVAAHDLKSPLIGISGMAKYFSEFYGPGIDEDGKEMLELIVSSSDKLRRLIDGLLEYSRSESVMKEHKSWINLEKLRNEIYGLFSYDNNVTIELKTTLTEIFANRTAIDQILINLIANAIKYSDKEIVQIEIGVAEEEDIYTFYVQDNGPGIDTAYQEQIFKIFEILASSDKYGQTGNGIGLATVKKIVERSGGSIYVESELGMGARFIFNLEK